MVGINHLVVDDIMHHGSAKEVELSSKERDAGHFYIGKKVADTRKTQVEIDLFDARERMDAVSFLIEEFNSKSKAQRTTEFEREEEANKEEYMQVMKQLEALKRDLNKWKTHKASLLEEKKASENLRVSMISRAKPNSDYIDLLRKQIEEANEDQVLVELARIEAVKESEVIKAQRESTYAHFSLSMKKLKRKKEEVLQELEGVKELKQKLAVTTSDIDALQNELNLVKAMDQRLMERSRKDRNDEESLLSSLKKMDKEVEDARKELISIKEEGFKLMGSMDVTRQELKNVSEERAQLKISARKADSTIHNLNSKIFKAKSKLKSATTSEDKAKLIVSSLLVGLNQIRKEADEAENQRNMIEEEISRVKLEIQSAWLNIDVIEKELQDSERQLDTVQMLESVALENLKEQCEQTMKTRHLSSMHSSFITISIFEYEYLRKRAEDAQQVAEKKVEAAEAWIEALKNEEKEILLETEAIENELEEMSKREEHQKRSMEKFSAKENTIESNPSCFEEFEMKEENIPQNKTPLYRKSMKERRRSSITGNGRPKVRTLITPSVKQQPRSPSFNRKRRRIMPNFVKFFRRNRT